MRPPIPVLSDYGISETRGFLPEVLPLTRLPDPYYNKWEAIADNFQALVLSKRLRPVVDRLPVLSTIGLEHDAEWRRAYSLLCFMAHGYIWGGDVPSDRLPPAITVPLLEIAARLEVPPVATYAAVCLWNFKPLFVNEAMDSLENLATLNTFTGSLDESWFYLVSVAIEARGAPALPLMLDAMTAAREGDVDRVTACLAVFAELLDDLGMLLQRMHENCDPAIFYNRIRPFLAGSKNMADAGLPDGVRYETFDGDVNAPFRQYSGGSNAQSSLIQFFDIVLGIEHRPTGDKGPSVAAAPTDDSAAPPPKNNFITEMRRYMPGPHARFLAGVSSVANLREFVCSRPASDRALRVSYDACLAMLRAFRDRHIAIVARYIVLPSRESRALSRSRSRSPAATRGRQPTRIVLPQRVNLATATRMEAVAAQKGGVDAGVRGTDRGNAAAVAATGAAKAKGTGGTALISFLKQARDETGEPAVEEWTHRFMKREVVLGGQKVPGVVATDDFAVGAPAVVLPAVPAAVTKREQLQYQRLMHDQQQHADQEDVELEEVEVAGLAGLWTVEDEVGGICNW